MVRKPSFTVLDFLWLGRERWIVHQHPLLKVFIWGLGPIGIHSRIRNAHVLCTIESLRLRNRAFVLDAGCGQAYASFWLARRYPDWEIWGVDLDREVIDSNRKIALSLRLKNLHFLESDVTSLNYLACFDLIFSIDVLEHVHSDLEALSCWRRAIRPNGWLILHLPIRHQIQKRVFPGFKGHLISDHVRDEYTAEEIESKLVQAGFAVRSIFYGFSIWGELAFELNNLFWRRPWIRASFALLTLPVSIFLGYVDVCNTWSEGNSLIVLAQPAK